MDRRHLVRGNLVRRDVVRRDVVGCDMELTTEAEQPLRVEARRPGWADVVEELRRSSVARAPLGGLWQRDGATAVVAGAAQVAWVHDTVDTADLEAMLAVSDLHEVWVSVTTPAVVDALVTSGWVRGEQLHQLVSDPAITVAPDAGAVGVVELGAADVPALRGLLRVQGVDERLLESHYPDDFFAVAAPVRVLGVREMDGSLTGAVAVRRQSRGAMGFALSVRPGARGRGLARSLVGSAVREAAALGAEFVHAQASGAGKACLESCGFSSVGTWQLMRRG